MALPPKTANAAARITISEDAILDMARSCQRLSPEPIEIRQDSEAAGGRDVVAAKVNDQENVMKLSNEIALVTGGTSEIVYPPTTPDDHKQDASSAPCHAA